MRVRLPLRRGADVGNSATLSDLAFLLIIFFIVIAVFRVNSGFLLSLPAKGSTRVVNVEEILRVRLAADGALAADGSPTDLAGLRAAALARRQVRPNMTVLLRIDPETPYQSVVDVVALVRQIDVENFSFVMQGGTP